MIQVLAVLWVVVGGALLVGFVWKGWLRPSRQQRRGGSGANLPAADDLDAEWIYGDHIERAPRAGRREIEEEPEVKAEAIVRAAELKAHEILAAAERKRREVEADLAREQERMAERSKKLSEFLASALEEVDRASGNGSASADDRAELEALREELQGNK